MWVWSLFTNTVTNVARSYTVLCFVCTILPKWICALFSVHTVATLWTNHSCILKMKTVMDANPSVRTVSQARLISSAGHFIQKDGSISRPHIDECCICKVCKESNDITIIS